MSQTKEIPLMEKIVSLCKRRGFIFQSSEIYGGINGFWDFGPLGAELKRNLRDTWWRAMMREREDVVPLDASIIMHPAVWKASVFECLAERTVARENLTRSKDPEKGYTPRLLDRVGAVLPACLENGVRIVSNMGAANPTAAARDIRRHARDNGLGEVSCTVVLGDDVAGILRKQPQLPLMS